MEPKKLVYYKTAAGKIPFQEWLDALKDYGSKSRIRARLRRIATGHVGDFKSVGPGICEFRFHFGPGYRIYFGFDGPVVIILLEGGDKSSQSRDILKALDYWIDYKRRKL